MGAARWVVVGTAGLAALLALTALPPRQESAPVVSGYDWAAPAGHRPHPSGFAVGVTHTQYSIDDWGDEAAIDSARGVLRAAATYQNQHLFGWGALNPEPAPGVYDWESLDRRMELIRATGGTPVLTLCCAPDWMKGGRAGETDWNRLHTAPLPEHYGDFADLAVRAAERYPDVRHFQVWNELKGFWDDAAERWDYEAYTRLYNTVYDALKRRDPGLSVGGPYVVVETWASRSAGGHPSVLSGQWGTVDQRSLDVLGYWLRYKHGADFVAVDAGMVTRDEGPLSRDARVNTAVFGAVTAWLRQITPLPVWWSEFHVGRADSGGQPRLLATAVTALLHMAEQGAAVALVWQPQRGAEEAHGVRPPALWSSTEVAGGGRPLAFAEALAWMQEVLADPAATPVAWPAPHVGRLNGRTGSVAVDTLPPYEVRYVPAGGAP
ncbi:hypothetical protein ACTMTJ_35820 [Phytohabitans sp. LJ34]|uniref:hypothetical protein n=1 Tax=Phytohabitans sp. LJ34 TaxID=3452217 RepID=UPI003F89636F